MGPHPLDGAHRLTLNGWPDRQGHVPTAARFYWSFHDELSINGDILTKGEQVVIPPSCRDSIMADLHGSHAGINKAMDLARTCIYWPSMEAAMTNYIKQCLTCIECSLYSRTFIVEMDHKPLEMISLKNVTAAPAHLQRMLLHLQQYDLVITYQPGKEMFLADALSHLQSRMNTEIKLDP